MPFRSCSLISPLIVRSLPISSTFTSWRFTPGTSASTTYASSCSSMSTGGDQVSPPEERWPVAAERLVEHAPHPLVELLQVVAEGLPALERRGRPPLGT